MSTASLSTWSDEVAAVLDGADPSEVAATYLAERLDRPATCHEVADVAAELNYLAGQSLSEDHYTNRVDW